MRVKLRANWLYKAKKTNQPAERKPVRTFKTRRHYTTVLECFFPHKKSNSSERTESPTARKSMANQMSIKQPGNWL